MNYLSVSNLTKYYGEKLLFEDLTFFIDKGDKVALVARNGTGKSTLIKILQGLEPPESGEVKFHKDIRTGYLLQDPKFEPKLTVYETILSSDDPVLKASLEYENALAGHGNLQSAMDMMEKLHAWDYEVKVKQILSRFLIPDLDQKVGSLSGGQQRRLALAILLLKDPDLLILDEPTNHLDLDMIEWLEEYLSQSQVTVLMITHDRYFLENICTDILEIDNGILYKHRGNFTNYLENKEKREENQRVNIERAQNTFRKELEWMRKQPKARTTKAKSRVDNFDEVEKRAKQRVDEKKVELEVRMQRLGGKIVELHNIRKSYGDKNLIDGFSYKFQRGERIGIVGKNGCGKSTLLNIITGQERYDAGNLVLGDTVVFGYYDQEGLKLKSDKRVIEVVKDIAEYLPLGKGNISAAQLLERFLFSFEQQYQYVSTLSGGELKRLYLLTILMQNPNFLILDEPTNDLDIMTLQVLEDFLMDFRGCLIVVSHDRYLLDKLTDHIFVFEGDGAIRDFIGNYNDYRDQLKIENSKKRKLEIENNAIAKAKEKRKLNFNEQRELEKLEREIEKLTKEKTQITEQLSSPSGDHNDILKLSTRMQEILHLLEEKEMRWLELSEYA